MNLAKIGLAGLIIALFGSSCAKNVDRIDFTKWGNSYIAPKATSFDTTAQGGAPNGNAPKNDANVMPKASVGGTYQRSFSASPRYRMVGGFHSTPSN